MICGSLRPKINDLLPMFVFAGVIFIVERYTKKNCKQLTNVLKFTSFNLLENFASVFLITNEKMLS